jgi:hypothetical protein
MAFIVEHSVMCGRRPGMRAFPDGGAVEHIQLANCGSDGRLYQDLSRQAKSAWLSNMSSVS